MNERISNMLLTRVGQYDRALRAAAEAGLGPDGPMGVDNLVMAVWEAANAGIEVTVEEEDEARRQVRAAAETRHQRHLALMSPEARAKCLAASNARAKGATPPPQADTAEALRGLLGSIRAATADIATNLPLSAVERGKAARLLRGSLRDIKDGGHRAYNFGTAIARGRALGNEYSHNPRLLARQLGVEIVDADSETRRRNAYAAAFALPARDGRPATITIVATCSAGERDVLVGHELGHLLLNHPSAFQRAQSEPWDAIEAEAEYFSAALMGLEV